jgi:hypothetical protein
MKIQNRRILSKMAYIVSLLIAWLALRPFPAAAAGTWIPLANKALVTIGTTLLLSDGTVMCSDSDPSQTTWCLLTPDKYGSYVNGTWTYIANAHYGRLYFQSDVLPDGRVYVAGGEDPSDTPQYTPALQKRHPEIYDPVANTWTVIDPPLSLLNPAYGDQIGDSVSVVTSDGTVLAAADLHNPDGTGNNKMLIYDPRTGVWSDNVLVYPGNQGECSWAKLADGSILTIDANATTSERYIPSQNQWVQDATVGDGGVPCSIWAPNTEIGPAVTLPNGNALFVGSSPQGTEGLYAVYTPSGNTSPGSWDVERLPDGQVAADVPGAMLFNGKALFCLGNEFPPYAFYEYDYTLDNPIGSAGAFTLVSGPPADVQQGISVTMLDLPDGTVLLSGGTEQLYVYQPDGSPIAIGKPTITSVTENADASYHLTGTGLNGISEGASFGDDAQMATDYPLVRLTDASSSLVYYARTFNWSSTSIQTGNTPESTEFTVPTNLPASTYALVVVANGIPSEPVTFNFAGGVWVDFNFGLPPPFGDGAYNDPYLTLGEGVSAVNPGGSIWIRTAGSSSETLTISKWLTIRAYNGPGTIGR